MESDRCRDGGGHIGYILVNPAIQTRPWQSGSIYLTRVENQAPPHLPPPLPSIFGNIQFPLGCVPGGG